jgi:hypothetical protein
MAFLYVFVYLLGYEGPKIIDVSLVCGDDFIVFTDKKRRWDAHDAVGPGDLFAAE